MSKVQYSSARNKSDNITIENAFTTEKLFIETSVEVKPVVMGDKGG